MDKLAERKVFNPECTSLSSEKAEAPVLMYGRLSRSTLIKTLSENSPSLLEDSSLESEEAEILSSDSTLLICTFLTKWGSRLAYHLIDIIPAEAQSLQSDSKHRFTIKMAWHAFGHQLPPTDFTRANGRIRENRISEAHSKTSSGQSEAPESHGINFIFQFRKQHHLNHSASNLNKVWEINLQSALWDYLRMFAACQMLA